MPTKPPFLMCDKSLVFSETSESHTFRAQSFQHDFSVVIGPPGSGKSALLAAAALAVPNQPYPAFCVFLTLGYTSPTQTPGALCEQIVHTIKDLSGAPNVRYPWLWLGCGAHAQAAAVTGCTASRSRFCGGAASLAGNLCRT
jgi:hypothetical protein